MSILKQTNDGDIDLSSGTAVIVDGAECLAYRMRNRVYSVRGAWFANKLIGIPYFDIIFVASPSESLVQSIFYNALRSFEDVDSISVLATFNRSTRDMKVEFEAKHDSGALITGGLGTPFAVN